MAKEWDIMVSNYERFWILRKDNESNDYCVMRKPVNLVGNGEPIKYYAAASRDEAIDIGCDIAKQHNLM